MRTYKVAKTVVQEVSAEEAIAALREAFGNGPSDAACPFREGDIIDIGQVRDSSGATYDDDDGEQIFLAYVNSVDTDDTVEIFFIDSHGEPDESGTWIPWKHATLVDRKVP